MTPSPRAARRWHLAVAVVAAGAVVFQLVLVVRGSAALLPEGVPSLPVRLVRFVSYFTILSNVLVAVTEAAAARGLPDTRVWRVLRLDAVVAIAVTGIVHWFVLRPLLDLHGSAYVADKLLHVVVPLLCVGGWALVGPRARLGSADLLPSLVFPVAWLVVTLVRGAATGWYPYPFVDADARGYGAVAVSCLGVAALFLALAGLLRWADPRLPGVSPASSGTTPRRPTGRT